MPRSKYIHSCTVLPVSWRSESPVGDPKKLWIGWPVTVLVFSTEGEDHLRHTLSDM